MSERTLGFEQLRHLVQYHRPVRLAKVPANVRFIKAAGGRVGLRPGSKVIDIGCGPPRARPTRARLVGPTGTVVGVDNNHDVLEVGRPALSRDGLGRVIVVHADVNQTDEFQLTSLGPDDVADCRLFLIDQRDPGATLRRFAPLVRPGGHLIPHELLGDPAYPVFDPPVPARSPACLRVHAPAGKAA